MTKQRLRPVITIGVTLVIAVLIIGPLIALIGRTLLGSSLQQLGQQLSTPLTQTSLKHSLELGGTTVLLAILIATPLAWIMSKTRLARFNWLHWLFLVPFMTPPYINAMGWIYFFQPHGLLAQWLHDPSFSANFLFSPFGMALVMSLHLYPVAYLLLRTAIQQFNQRWLQASVVHGASKWRTLTRITLPLMLVPYLATWLLIFTKTLAEFGTPATFGRKIHYDVLTTTIQKDLSQWPLNFQNGVLTGSCLLIIALLAWSIQQLFVRRSKMTASVNQQVQLRLSPFATLLATSFTGILLLTAVGIPYSSIILQSLLKQRSVGVVAGNWTLSHYLDLLRFDSPAFQALATTVLLAVTIAVLNLLLGIFISVGSLATNQPRWLQKTLRLLGALPLAIPNVVLALSLMIFFSQLLSFTKLYGTLVPLLVADVILFLPTTVQYLTAALREFDTQLLQSARVFEPNRWRIMGKILFPMLLPALLNSFVMAFIATSRELVVALLLLPSGTTTISTFIYQSFEQGDASQGMALAVITVGLTFIITLIVDHTLNTAPHSN